MALPITYNFPACDSAAYASVLEHHGSVQERATIPLLLAIRPVAVGVVMKWEKTLSATWASCSNWKKSFHWNSRSQLWRQPMESLIYATSPSHCCSSVDCRLPSNWMSGFWFKAHISQTNHSCRKFGDNRWNVVCSDLFDQNDLRVACRALGFTQYEHTSANHHFIPAIAFTTGTAFEQALNCSGFERHLSECGLRAAPTRDNSVCLDTRIECLGNAWGNVIVPSLWAPARILLSPVLYSSALVVEEHRKATLQCVIDEAGHSNHSQTT